MSNEQYRRISRSFYVTSCLKGSGSPEEDSYLPQFIQPDGESIVFIQLERGFKKFYFQEKKSEGKL